MKDVRDLGRKKEETQDSLLNFVVKPDSTPEPKQDTEDPYYDALIRQRVSQALRCEDDGHPLDTETLQHWVSEDHRKKAERRGKYMSMAAVVLLAVCTVFGIRTAVEHKDFYAEADKHPPVSSEEDGNVVIKDNDVDAGGNPGMETITVNSWDGIAHIKKQYPELMIPGYVPEGYAFTELTVESNALLERYHYSFASAEQELQIVQTVGDKMQIIKNYDKKIEISETDSIYVKEDITNSAYYVKGNTLFVIKGSFENEEYKQIIKGLRR